MEYIKGNIRKLSEPDRPPQISIADDEPQTNLVVQRDGDTELLLVSRRVAEELIAAGFAHGD